MDKDKYLIKALNALELEIDNVGTEKELDQMLKDENENIAKMETIIIEAKEVIEAARRNVEWLEMIKHQIKVERYKELNPDREIF